MIVSLIGPRGAGKSTLGAGRLAARLGLEYVSIDERIAQAAGRSIPEIVRADGWVQFRILEEKVLADAAQADDRLLDCGGGIVEVPANRERLRRAGPVVWIDAPLAVLIRRTAGDGDRPPLTEDDDPAREMELVVARRDPLYPADRGAGRTQRRGRPGFRLWGDCCMGKGPLVFAAALVLIAVSAAPAEPFALQTLVVDGKVSDVYPADLTGDGLSDLLVTYTAGQTPDYTRKVAVFVQSADGFRGRPDASAVVGAKFAMLDTAGTPGRRGRSGSTSWPTTASTAGRSRKTAGFGGPERIPRRARPRHIRRRREPAAVRLRPRLEGERDRLGDPPGVPGAARRRPGHGRRRNAGDADPLVGARRAEPGPGDR